MIHERAERPGHRKWIVLGAATAVTMAVAATAVWFTAKEHPAEIAVQDFFAAVQSKDVEAALALASTDAEPGDFLVPEAISDRWGLTGTELVEDRRGHPAVVEAEFATPGGTVRQTYKATRTREDSWELFAPLVTVRLEISPAAYLQANDAIVPVDNLGVDGGAQTERTFELFPGVYEFYPSVPGVVDMEEREPELLFEPRQLSEPVPIPVPAMTPDPEAVAALQDDADRLIDGCLENHATYRDDCPFRHSTSEVIAVDGVDLWSFEEVQWSIESYPQITLGSYPSPDWPPEYHWEYGFLIGSPGAEDAVTFTAVGEPRHGDGDDRAVAVQCDYDFTVWVASLNGDGTDITLDLDLLRPGAGSDYTTCTDAE
jgi:hypothetical protein